MIAVNKYLKPLIQPILAGMVITKVRSWSRNV